MCTDHVKYNSLKRTNIIFVKSRQLFIKIGTKNDALDKHIEKIAFQKKLFNKSFNFAEDYDIGAVRTRAKCCRDGQILQSNN